MCVCVFSAVFISQMAGRLCEPRLTEREKKRVDLAGSLWFSSEEIEIILIIISFLSKKITQHKLYHLSSMNNDIRSPLHIHMRNKERKLRLACLFMTWHV